MPNSKYMGIIITMKVIILDLKSEKLNAGWNKLRQKLTGQQIEIRQWSEGYPVAGSLLLSDNRQQVQREMRRGAACIGFEQPGEPPFYGPETIIQGFEEIDVAFLKEAYCRFHKIPIEKIRTGRLLIRESVIADAGELSVDPDQLTSYIKWMYPFYRYGLWSVVERSSGEVIGRAGLENQKWQGNEVVEIGYAIRPERQRCGYGLEAAAAVRDYAFAELGINRLYAFIEADNIPSTQLITKLGFRPEQDRTGGIRVFSCDTAAWQGLN